MEINKTKSKKEMEITIRFNIQDKDETYLSLCEKVRIFFGVLWNWILNEQMEISMVIKRKEQPIKADLDDRLNSEFEGLIE